LLTPLLLWVFCQTPAPPPPKPESAAEAKPEASRRVELNLLRKEDSQAGESRRNENVQFNLVDNNALKELNIRLGTSATITPEFQPDRNYFGSEYGNAPPPGIHLAPAAGRGFHGGAYFSHLNTAFSARSFFQAGAVKPAHENDYGFQAGFAPWARARLQLDGSQQRIRGFVNGNVLVPRPDERTPLAQDPAVRALVARFLAAYPTELPNRTDVNPRALNTNSPQTINNHTGGLRLDQTLAQRDRLTALYSFTTQHVEAFQLVKGQNPNTDTRSHRARLTWARSWSARTVTELSAGLDRVGSLLLPERNAVGPMVSVAGLETLGPQGSIPIDRAQNVFRYAGAARLKRASHEWFTGFGVLRRQMNGIETDAHRGFFSFANDFGRDSITNFRMGLPTQHIVSVGDVHRGYRNWDLQFFAGDKWQASRNLTVTFGLRYQPVTTPAEVNQRNIIPYQCDCNNLAPQLGLAYRLPGAWGVLRANYGLHFGEIFPVTFSQVRFSPPGSVKLVILAPNLINPLTALGQTGTAQSVRGNLYLLSPDLVTPYSHQYSLSWETAIARDWRVQLGYVGSRQDKLLLMIYRNRAHPVPNIAQTTATINERRPNPSLAEIREVVNGSRGYYDAGRVALVVPRWRGLSLDIAYWFSKAIDLGSAYTNTGADADSRISRSQWEYEQHNDMKGLSPFDQPHAFLARAAYTTPKAAGSRGRWVSSWQFSVVTLQKSGTPFNVQAGSDGPGFGNVDGNGGDRPNLVDPSILGRTIGNPDTSRARLPRDAFSYMRPTDPRGNLGRHVFRKGPLNNVNASLARSFSLGGDRQLTVRAESINFLNTPQFAEPGPDLANPNFAQITNTLNDGRTFRFSMRFGW